MAIFEFYFKQLRRCPFSQHLFASENRDDMRSAIERAGNFIGITLRLRKEALTFDDFVTDRLGKYSSDDGITSLAEFVVQKITPRHPVRAASPCSPRCAGGVLNMRPRDPPGLP